MKVLAVSREEQVGSAALRRSEWNQLFCKITTVFLKREACSESTGKHRGWSNGYLAFS